MTTPSPSTDVVPGCRGIEHIGLTVPDLGQAVDFFITVFGWQKIYELGPLASDDGSIERQLGVAAGTVMQKLAFMRCANGANLELFQYASKDQTLTLPANSDVGGHHLAFYVDDFTAALACLRRHNLPILGDPVVRNSGPSGGQTWIYFKTPWGLTCELVSYPRGKAYETNSTRRLWHPPPL
jgi:catechol 2,3-dioxygenase-like lactoylglutathione lyase family enzyme